MFSKHFMLNFKFSSFDAMDSRRTSVYKIGPKMNFTIFTTAQFRLTTAHFTTAQISPDNCTFLTTAQISPDYCTFYYCTNFP